MKLCINIDIPSLAGRLVGAGEGANPCPRATWRIAMKKKPTIGSANNLMAEFIFLVYFFLKIPNSTTQLEMKRKRDGSRTEESTKSKWVLIKEIDERVFENEVRANQKGHVYISLHAKNFLSKKSGEKWGGRYVRVVEERSLVCVSSIWVPI